MKLYKDRMQNKHGFLTGASDSVDQETVAKAMLYKKNIAKRFLSISPEQIDLRLSGKEFYVTRKYDGEFNVIAYECGDAVIINRNGNVRTGIPCTNEVANLLSSAGVKSAIIPAELYVDESAGRTRVFQVLKAVADESMLDMLRLAPFDILEIDGKYPEVRSFEDIHLMLSEIFDNSCYCKPVMYEKALNKNDVKNIYEKWVGEGKSEGLVVHTNFAFSYKVKPRFSADLIIVGFSEGVNDYGQIRVRSLLLAVANENGIYQIIGKVGSGIDDETGLNMYEMLRDRVIKSYYIETDSDHVAFRIVRAEVVVEIMVNDVISESASESIINPIIEVKDDICRKIGDAPGIHFLSPVFVRIRDDKKATYDNAGFDQFKNIIELHVSKFEKTSDFPLSQILKKEIYIKNDPKKIMIQKYIIWATNKQDYGNYPAFVLHYTDFSTGRKDLLKREIRISDVKDQIFELMDELIGKNVKKGWYKYE